MKRYAITAAMILVMVTTLPLQAADQQRAAATDGAQAEHGAVSSEDFRHWLQIAQVANAMYQDQDAVKPVLETLGYTITAAKNLPGYSVAYVLATNDQSRQHMIAVRGTANVENVIVDAAFVLVDDAVTDVHLHQGFKVSANDIVEDVLPLLKPGYTVNTVGHSLGGAAALVVAMMLDAKGYDVGEVITFGQPKVTDIPGSRKYSHLDVTRIVTPKDMVPLVPPFDPSNFMNLGVFYHLGTEVLLYPDERYSVLEGMDSMLRAATYLDDIPEQAHISDHFMTSYIKSLETKQKSAQQVPFEHKIGMPSWFQ
jgi:triacylglycerol lipase